MPLVRRWKALFDRYGTLPLDEYVRMATDLTDVQFESLPLLDHEERLSTGGLDLFAIQRGRFALRLYGLLSPAQRQALWRGAAIPVARMTAAQRELFLADVREGGRDRTPAPDRQQWAGGSFSMSVQPVVRTIEQHEDGISVRSDNAPPAGGPGPAAPRAPGSGPAPAPVAAGPMIRQQASEVNFHFQYGPQEQDNVSIAVASPP